MTLLAAAAAIGVAFVATLAGSVVTARSGPIDAPGGRTSHHRPTPTSGGLVLLGAVALGLWAYAAIDGVGGGMAKVGLALLFAAGAGLTGALDDMADLNAKVKLAVSIALAAGFVALAGPVVRLPGWEGWSLPLWPAVGLIGAALWIVTASNAVNFMDGANGLAPGALAVSFAALAIAAFGRGAPAIGVAAACGAASCAGLLPLNMRGRLFQGDVGALFAAFFFAALCLAAAGSNAEGPVTLYFGPIALMPFLADVLLTLLARAAARKPLLSAHREHLYQRWLQHTGKSHGALAWRAAVVMAAFGALAVGVAFTSETGQASALLLAVVLCVIGWRRIGRGLRPAA